MTNGEMIQKIFNCEVCEPIIEEDIIHVIFPDKNDSAIGFDWSWWNAEYKEPTTKNNLGVDCISRTEVLKLMQDNWHTHNGDWAMQESMDDIRALPPVTPQEPRWIPASERLPKANEHVGNVAKYYLVQNEYGDMLVARYDGIGWEQIYQHKYLEDDVIAWMPLPTPYEPQESEDKE